MNVCNTQIIYNLEEMLKLVNNGFKIQATTYYICNEYNISTSEEIKNNTNVFIECELRKKNDMYIFTTFDHLGNEQFKYKFHIPLKTDVCKYHYEICFITLMKYIKYDFNELRSITGIQVNEDNFLYNSQKHKTQSNIKEILKYKNEHNQVIEKTIMHQRDLQYSAS